jgi:hypothetical protein
VLDWRPSEYFTVNTLLPIPGAAKIMLTHAFRSAKWRNACRNAGWQAQAEGQSVRRSAGARFKENITKAIGNLRLMVEDQPASLSVIDEPPMIASSERFLNEPVKSSAS